MPGIDVLNLYGRQSWSVVGHVDVKGFEDETDMVTERVLFQNAANEPALTVLEQRYAVGSGLPTTLRELVRFISGGTPEKFCKVMLRSCEHMYGVNGASLATSYVWFFTDRHTMNCGGSILT